MSSFQNCNGNFETKNAFSSEFEFDVSQSTELARVKSTEIGDSFQGAGIELWNVETALSKRPTLVGFRVISHDVGCDHPRV
jgi:hypothetical protein